MCGPPRHLGVLRKRDNAARGPQRGADTIDIGYDFAGHRHFRHLAAVHEAVLQIDDDMRGVARTQAVKHRDATAPEHDALADFVLDTRPMHRFTTSLKIRCASRVITISHFSSARRPIDNRRSRKKVGASLRVQPKA